MIGHTGPHYWLTDHEDPRFDYCGLCGIGKRTSRPSLPERLAVVILVQINRFLRWLAA